MDKVGNQASWAQFCVRCGMVQGDGGVVILAAAVVVWWCAVVRCG